MATAAQSTTTASTKGNVSGTSELLQIVTFHIGSEVFGLNILNVHEIIRYQPLTRVPNLPSYVEGVLNLRGRVIPVVGLRQKMGLPRQEPTGTTKIVVATVNDDVLGFMVDSVSEVLRMEASSVESAPRLVEGRQRYVSGVGKMDNCLLILLDLNKLLTDDESAAVVATTAGVTEGASS